ncbi:hypothetical protein HF888_11805 [Bermanella marisrubri]|uniref:CheW-like domain containing protein n=1 Tax=Bermanella marisrubri TaxID=207949 RepID=Q1N2T6_9GAMM|nr:chemotaxis protein CheW [Bermanella marisrubri]EAT12583.1 CheW-like domain containing protein [Oceanobacter sp. RED65] [Bermanella marisrubri]QIZ84861.1 hypothetical protein HF888_11805 [Bermanella marisrubri]
MSKPTNIKTLTQPAQTEEVVQEYMDNLLAETFPDIPDHPVNNVVELAQPEPEKDVIEDVENVDLESKVEVHKPITEADTQLATETKEVTEQAIEHAIETKPDVPIETSGETSVNDIVDARPEENIDSKPIEKRYPKAPDWAQEEFDVLLFEVCGLKLAVSMEALGRIIKVDHETNHLIGRPDWFLGAYNESDNHYYVVDTAKYIMPEKGFDLSESGYEFVIQMQHSKWTLACQKLHTTVRLHPESVKWRTEKGKRPWLAGTVVDQMCALVHVDSLIEILNEAAAS